MIPSVMPRTRSSSLGKEGSLVKHQDIVPFGLVVDGIGQLAAAPLLDLHRRAVLLSEGLELRHHRGDALLTECRIDDVDDLVIGGNLSHFCTSFWTDGPHSKMRARICSQTASHIIIPDKMQKSRRFLQFFRCFPGKGA